MKIFFIFLIFLSCQSGRNLNSAHKHDSTKVKELPNDVKVIKTDTANVKVAYEEREPEKVFLQAPATETSAMEYQEGMGSSDIAAKNVTVIDKAKSTDLKESIGLIAYSVPKEMQVGKDYSVKIRISKEEIKNALVNGDNGISINDVKVKSVVKIENVRVSNVMSAALTGNDDEYKIESKSTETQDIEDKGYTEWEWNVNPLKGGDNVLKLVVKVQLEDENHFFKDIVVFEKNIPIKSNVVYSVKTFFNNNWQWLITTFIIPLAIWWYEKRKKKKKKN